MLAEILAILSASAAGGLRLALPLLLVTLLHGDRLWQTVPFLAGISPYVVLSVLISWSLFELLASKKLLGQRLLQVIQILLSPFVGTVLGLAVASFTSVPGWPISVLGGLLALVLQLVQAGWFYRLGGLPQWAILAQDGLCVALIVLALDAPQQGGLIALFLLWLAIRSGKAWKDRYGRRALQKPLRQPD